MTEVLATSTGLCELKSIMGVRYEDCVEGCCSYGFGYALCLLRV